MILLKIYMGFCLVIFLIVEIGTYEIEQQVKKKCKDKINKNRNRVKQNFLVKFCEHIKMLIACFIPIVNIGMFWMLLFNNVKIQEDVLNKVDKSLKEK